MSSCPGSIASSPTSRSGPWASTTACAANTFSHISTSFVFRFNRRRTRHAAFRSLLGIAAAHQPSITTCRCRQSIAVSLWEYYSSVHPVLTGEHLDLQDVENRILQRESRLEIHFHAWTGKGFRQMLDAVSDALEFVVLCHIFCGNGNIFVLERRPRSRHDCSRLITGPKRQKHANSGHASELSPARPSPAVALPNARRRSG